MSTKPALHFTHANSFPAVSYRKFLSAFERDFDVGFIDMLGHNPAYPVTDCWPNLVDESLHYIEARYAGPVIAVGHSLGGFISFLCAIKRPELFRAVVLLDSPIFSRRVSSMLWLGKRLGFIERLTPGRGSRTRRHRWTTSAEVLTHFQARAMFAAFDPDCLKDYVEGGTHAVEEGVQLRFEREVEYRIYCGLPHIFPSLQGQLRVPTGFIGGSHSDYVRTADIRHMRRGFGIVTREFDGGHLFPLEAPLAAARSTRDMIETLLSSPR
ncbi:MAG: alpha/beta hydrolase [Burkholderiales bacterium]|nr:alpha/beta hydrolase [Burkholderiales bacterium]